MALPRDRFTSCTYDLLDIGTGPISLEHQQRAKLLELVKSPANRPTTFQDLPGELRNLVYQSPPCPLRRMVNRNAIRLCLKQKVLANGRIVISEPTPAICYAAPLLWKETLSFYYAENCFRVNITTAKRRDTFHIWAQHRKPLLKSLKSLRLVWRSHFHQKLKHWSDKKIHRFRVDVDLDEKGQLCVAHPHHYHQHHRNPYWRSYEGCFCSFLESSLKARAAVEKMGSKAVNPVVEYALEFCNHMDLVPDRCDELELVEMLDPKD